MTGNSNSPELRGKTEVGAKPTAVPHQNPIVMIYSSLNARADKLRFIRKHQKEQGYAEMQHLIETGLAWKMEGAIGRSAMELLRSGACFLPKQCHLDYYGNRVPSRNDVKKGTTGSLENAYKFFTENKW